MAAFLTSDWQITPEMEAELERVEAEDPLPESDDASDDTGESQPPTE